MGRVHGRRETAGGGSVDGPGPDPPQCLGGVSLGIPRLGRAAVRLRGPVAAKDSDPGGLRAAAVLARLRQRGGRGREARESAFCAPPSARGARGRKELLGHDDNARRLQPDERRTEGGGSGTCGTGRGQLHEAACLIALLSHCLTRFLYGLFILSSGLSLSLFIALSLPPSLSPPLSLPLSPPPPLPLSLPPSRGTSALLRQPEAWAIGP